MGWNLNNVRFRYCIFDCLYHEDSKLPETYWYNAWKHRSSYSWFLHIILKYPKHLLLPKCFFNSESKYILCFIYDFEISVITMGTNRIGQFHMEWEISVKSGKINNAKTFSRTNIHHNSNIYLLCMQTRNGLKIKQSRLYWRFREIISIRIASLPEAISEH